MITNINNTFITLALHYECGSDPKNPKWLKAYLDSGGVWTIGAGCITHPNGQRIQKGDTITTIQWQEYFTFHVREKVARLNVMTRDDLNQNQFNALADLVYNAGSSNIQKSSLLKIVNTRPNDIGMINKFCEWRFDNGVFVPGLLRRRMSDALVYFTGRLKFDWINYRKLTDATINEIKKEITKKSFYV